MFKREEIKNKRDVYLLKTGPTDAVFKGSKDKLPKEA